jgi:hypothetical protein
LDVSYKIAKEVRVLVTEVCPRSDAPCFGSRSTILPVASGKIIFNTVTAKLSVGTLAEVRVWTVAKSEYDSDPTTAWKRMDGGKPLKYPVEVADKASNRPCEPASSNASRAGWCAPALAVVVLSAGFTALA